MHKQNCNNKQFLAMEKPPKEPWLAVCGFSYKFLTEIFDSEDSVKEFKWQMAAFQRALSSQVLYKLPLIHTHTVRAANRQFCLSGRCHTQTNTRLWGPSHFWTLSGVFNVRTISAHLLSCPACSTGHASLTVPSREAGSSHYARATISGVQMSFTDLK